MSTTSTNLILILTYTILLLCFAKPSAEQQLTAAAPSSPCATTTCGGIAVSYPFRLRTQPADCGLSDPAFELRCEANRNLMLTLGSRDYRVAEINYGHFRVRAVDPGLDRRNYSSCPVYDYTDGLWENDNLSPDLSYFNDVVTFISCTRPLSGGAWLSSFVEEDSCAAGNTTSSSSRVYSYVGFSRILNSDLQGYCAVNREVLASSREMRGGVGGLYGVGGNYSYEAIHDLMARGVELTWYRTMCGICGKGACAFVGDRITCADSDICYEDTPLSERSFRCKLDYYSMYWLLLGLIIGGIVGLRLLIGVPLLIALLVYKWRKHRRSLAMAKDESNC